MFWLNTTVTDTFFIALPHFGLFSCMQSYMGMFSNEEMFLAKIIGFDIDNNVVWHVTSIPCPRAVSDRPLETSFNGTN